jgi:hypothetical protein
MIPEESNVCSKVNRNFRSTPLGSHHLLCSFFYKHTIPSGLEFENQNHVFGSCLKVNKN